MRIEQIDKDEILGLNCPKTGTRILWSDEDIADGLSGTVVLALIMSPCPEECAVEGLPLAEAWKSHHASVDAWKLGLDGVIEAFPVSGKALKVVYGGITCGLVHDVVYYIVPEDLSEDCLIHADFEDDADAVEK